MHTALLLVALAAVLAAPELQLQAAAGCVVVLDQDRPVLAADAPGTALYVLQPQGRTNVAYTQVTPAETGLELRGGAAPGLALTESWRRLNPGLYERVVTVTAGADGRYYLEMAWRAPEKATYHTFLGEETESKTYSPSCTGAGFGDNAWQTFPMIGCRVGDLFYGVLGDSPGLWENRSFLGCEPQQKRIFLASGDGSAERVVMIPREVDATSVYRARFDGWQHIEAGETQSFTTWVFASSVRDQYGIQLSAHLALANAKGFNRSALEAILRNTSYLLLRRNLLRPESDYIFISGVGYGWKQWVSDVSIQ